MKKLVLLGIAASALLSGCCCNDVMEQNAQNAIAFDQSFVDSMTKSNDYNNGNLPASVLYGTIITPEGNAYYAFDKKKIESDGSYQDVQYWRNDAVYTFTAFAPYEVASQLTYSKPNAADASDIDRGTLVFNNKEHKGEVDLMKAVCPQFTFDAASSERSVSLNFKHQLSRLRFRFDNALGTDAYVLKISGLKITNAAEELVMNVASDDKDSNVRTFALDFETSEIVEGVPTDYLIGNNMSLETDHKYLIANKGDLKVEFKIEMMQVDEAGKLHLADTFDYTGSNAVVVKDFNMVKGQSYRLSVELNKMNIDPDHPAGMEEIKFTVSTDDWGEWNDSMIK